MIIAIILGIIILKTKGFNYSTVYSEHERLEISLGDDYNIKDIKKNIKSNCKWKSNSKNNNFI